MRVRGNKPRNHKSLKTAEFVEGNITATRAIFRKLIKLLKKETFRRKIKINGRDVVDELSRNLSKEESGKLEVILNAASLKMKEAEQCADLKITKNC